jgi:hypothetical protein
MTINHSCLPCKYPTGSSVDAPMFREDNGTYSYFSENYVRWASVLTVRLY